MIKDLFNSLKKDKTNKNHHFEFLDNDINILDCNYENLGKILVDELFKVEYNGVFRPSKKADEDIFHLIDQVNKTIQFPKDYDCEKLKEAYNISNMTNVKSKIDFEVRLINGLMSNMPDEADRWNFAKRVANSIVFDKEDISKTDFSSQIESIKEMPNDIRKIEVIANAYDIAKEELDVIGNNKDKDNLIRSMAYKKVIDHLASIYADEYEIAKTEFYYNLD